MIQSLQKKEESSSIYTTSYIGIDDKGLSKDTLHKMETYYSYKKQESLGANKGNVPERTYKYYPDEFYK